LPREGLALAALGDRQVRLEEMLAAVADEGKQGIDIALEVVEEDATDAARLAAVRQVEIIVAPLLEAGMVGDAWMAAADLTPDAVEVNDVFAVGIVRRQVGAAAEPLTRALGQEAEVGVNGRHQRTGGVQHQRDATGGKE